MLAAVIAVLVAGLGIGIVLSVSARRQAARQAARETMRDTARRYAATPVLVSLAGRFDACFAAAGRQWTPGVRTCACDAAQAIVSPDVLCDMGTNYLALNGPGLPVGTDQVLVYAPAGAPEQYGDDEWFRGQYTGGRRWITGPWYYSDICCCCG